MGTSAFPWDEESARRLEAVMASPLPARSAEERLEGLVSDDTLSDMLSAAARRDPGADARPLVAMTLDEWVNWSAAGSFRAPVGAPTGSVWSEAVRDRLRAIVDRHAMDAVADLVPRTVLSEVAADAGARAAAVLGLDPGDLETRAGFAPGTYAVRDPSSGRILRVEAVYGCVSEPPADLAGEIAEALFAQAPGPGR